MSSLISLDKPKKAPLTRSQRTFKMLKKKVADLERTLKEVFLALDDALSNYNKKILPAEKSVIALLGTLVKNLHAHYKGSLSFSKKERLQIKNLILVYIDRIFGLAIPHQLVDPEIARVYEELEGVSYEEELSKSMDEMKKELEKKLKADGIDVDLSSIHLFGNQREIEKQLFDAIKDLRARKGETPTKPKSKKQLDAEEKINKLQEAKTKGLSNIYKQLAKTFHPDLEQDKELKIEKEKFMKRLTHAYERDDLHAILTLELEWKKRENTERKDHSEEQLVTYNAILKDQVRALEEEISTSHMHPKYLSIQDHFTDPFFGHSPFNSLKIYYSELKAEINFLKENVPDLDGPQAEKILRSMING